MISLVLLPSRVLRGNVVSCSLVTLHTDECDAVQGAVAAPVTTAVETVAVGAARGGGDGSDAAEGSEGCLVADPLRVAAGGDDELCSDNRSSAVNTQDLRIVLGQDGAHLLFELIRFALGIFTGLCQLL